MFVGAGPEIWGSTDAGRTWVKCDNIGGKIKSFLINNKVMFAAINNGIYISDDYGKTWSLKNKGLPGGEVLSFCGGSTAGKTVIYCIVNNDAYRSFDKGENWESAMGRGIKTKEAYNKVVCAENNPDIIYLNTPSEFLVFKSGDSGNNWKNCYFPSVESGNVNIGWLSYEYGTGWGGPFNTGFNINPANPDYVAGTNYGEIILTIDGGKTWKQIYSKPVDTPKKGARWTSTGLEVTAAWNYYIDPHDNIKHYICYSDIGFARSEDGGKTWVHSVDGNPWRNTIYELAFDPDNAGVIYAAASKQHGIPYWPNIEIIKYGGGVIKSVDYGKTWASISKGLPDKPATSIIKDNNTIFAAMFGDGVYRSDDKGETWVKKSNGLGNSENMHVFSLKLHKNGDLFCSITGKRTGGKFPVPGGLYKSTDKGDNWGLLKELHWTTNFDVDPDNSYVIYLAGCAIPGGHDEGGVYKTVDGGKVWDKLNIDFPVEYLNYVHVYGIFINPEKTSSIYITTGTHGMFHSNDNGKTWKEVDGFPFIGTTRITWDKDNMYVSTQGAGVWKNK
ncbi:MAG: hypothetical protein A2283_03275 [Lentisphaerae bacterium RIFOXYA12_FULL_48_11]|nr:MAG: hypothetical protein A2283_03275 [Lentisphaerae bacterium RIFOXYA12_FULL_48_11]